MTAMNNQMQYKDTPPWWVFLALPLLHFASVKLSFYCATTKENEVVVWLPNAILLAALLHFQGRRGGTLALLSFSSDVLGNLPAFPFLEAVLLSLVNLFETLLAWALMRRAGAAPTLSRIADFRLFVLLGPLFSAFCAASLAALVIKSMETNTPAYLTMMRVWWFGDGLGMLIYTPLLLAFARKSAYPIRFHWIDGIVLTLSVELAWLIFDGHGKQPQGTFFTPTLLLPSAVFIAARFGVRWATVSTAGISLICAWVLTRGDHPFGAMPMYLEILRTQEFILTLCIISLGFAILLNELKIHERGLEMKVLQRTRELEESNDKLVSMSMTDGLTGIANRRHFDVVLAREWQQAQHNDAPLALALIDVDWFKNYNDHYGHLAGDDCLRTVANVIAYSVGPDAALVARYGGEEFAFIAPAADGMHAMKLASRLRAALAHAGVPHVASPLGQVTVSIGIAALRPADGGTPEQLFAQADAALYRVKSAGKNQALFAESDLA